MKFAILQVWYLSLDIFCFLLDFISLIMKVHSISLVCSLHNLVKIAHCLIYFMGGYKKFSAIEFSIPHLVLIEANIDTHRIHKDIYLPQNDHRSFL